EKLKVFAQERLTTCEMNLNDTELLGLAEYTYPRRGIHGLRMQSEVDRIGAVSTPERTVIGQLGNERVGPAYVHEHTSTRPRSTRDSRSCTTSSSMRDAVTSGCRALRHVTTSRTGRSPEQSARISAALRLRRR